ncbi:hypothetical protein D3093_27845 (plasmid) [Azospirillum argentinense]|uniref:CopL family metal-binding regulatory protein n=2 Tax=Azospirillum argentinense TaxID=2970906 RepID=A0A4D8PQF1_9PROT|nr:hypothetical protein D3093_27845 [Azospirillum argentinense]
MARGGRPLGGMLPVGRLVAGLLLLVALALFAPSVAQAHVHAGAHADPHTGPHAQGHAASSAPTPAGRVWVGDADHTPPAEDACAGRNGLSCGGACPMMLSGIATTAAFPMPPLRASMPFRPTGLLPEGIGPPPALRPPRLAV